MNIENININNNVTIDELFNNKYWIHGNSKSDIKITIFLITICDVVRKEFSPVGVLLYVSVKNGITGWVFPLVPVVPLSNKGN